ncbi:MAG: Lrp/AsnC family transcriptional regulator [bacterium]|nr:Lrp/AsnC family transcriptional regulator [bacterium]
MKTETALIKHLRNDARKSLLRISMETGLPTSSLCDKLKKLEGNLIIRHVTLLDFQRIGYGLKANVLIKVKDKEKLREFLLKNQNVNSVFRTNNNMDFFAECIFQSMSELEDFCERLDALKAKKKIHFVTAELKREGFFSNTSLALRRNP